MQTATDTLRATQPASQDRRSLTPLADNAFRLLGLSGHASQREIYAAASALRRAIKLGVVKTHAPDIDWLAPPDRTENGVRDALGRLTIPAQRIYERLFWFFDPHAASAHDPAATRDADALAPASASPAAMRHDLALLSLARLLRFDPALELADDWRRTYALWKELIEGREFWSLLMAADVKGDFEQLAAFSEIGELRVRAWRLVTAPLAEIVKDDILRGDRARASRALAVLHATDLPQALADEYEQEILGPCEDEFEVLLAGAFATYRYEVKTEQNVAERRATCWRGHEKFDETVRPALKKILELGGAQSAVVRRVFATAADALDELAEGFETGFDNEARIRMLRKAWQLAPPESASLLLIEEHLAAAGEAGERPPKTEDDYARQLSFAVRERPPQPELFTDYVRREEAEKSLERWGKGASRFIFFVVFALLVGKCFNSLPGSRTRGIDRAMNLNIPVPRFTPQTPKLYSDALVGSVSVSELQAKLKAKTVTLLHVGAKGEYETGHIPGALWMPEDEVFARARRLPKGKPIVVYCFCGELEANRRAAGELRILGFTDVSVLEGGYRAWLDAGLPVEPARRGLVRNGSAN